MNGIAHTIMGASIGSMAINAFQPDIPPSVIIMGTSILGALAPDIENVHSIVGRRFPIISSILNMVFGHRGLLHSPLFLAFLWFVLARIPIGQYRTIFYVGYASHLLQDLFTSGGIPLFFPIHRKVRLSPFDTGGIMDYVITFIFIAILNSI